MILTRMQVANEWRDAGGFRIFEVEGKRTAASEAAVRTAERIILHSCLATPA